MPAALIAAAAEGLPRDFTDVEERILPTPNPEGEIHKLNHIIELAFDDLAELVNAACTNRDADITPRRRQAVAYALYALKDQAQRVLDSYYAHMDEAHARAAA